MSSKVAPQDLKLEQESSIEKNSISGVSQSDEERLAIDKALVRKIDLKLRRFKRRSFIFLGQNSYWVVSTTDLAIGNAKLFGLLPSLKLTDPEYLLCLTIFFFSYAGFEVPSNVLLKRLRPSIWLPGIMLFWGVVMILQGVVMDFNGLMAARWFLGVAEAGLFPGVTYYLSCWYKRSEYGLRAAVFFSAATVSGAFGGLIAAGIGGGAVFQGLGGYPSWAWIFFIEGIITVLVGVAGFWLVYDFPDTASFLTDEERVLVIARLQGDDQFSAAGEAFSMKYLWDSLRDWKTWVGIAMYSAPDAALYAFALFIPTIIKSTGKYTATEANLLSVPIYVWACGLTVTVGYFADKLKSRIYFNFGFLSVGAAGYLILLFSKVPALSYFGCFLAAAGIYPLIPNTIALVSNNVEGSLKRGVTLGMVISVGNIQGAVSSNIYRAVQAPYYPLGHGVVLGYLVMGICANATYYYFVKKENARRERGERDEVISGSVEVEGQLVDGKEHYSTLAECKRIKGDRWSGYRYTL